MSDIGHVGRDALADRLVADLRPVRRLHGPVMRTVAWVGVVAAIALLLGSFANLTEIGHRLASAPDMWLAVLGSTATAVLAALAAFELSLPDRSRTWALLPLPALALWVGASGLGCARTWLVPGHHVALWDETRNCLMFIVAMSIPLSALTIVMLRRGFSLAPALTGATGGLAVASASATLLNFFHPYDAALDDLLVHAAAVALVVTANRLLAGRALRAGASWPASDRPAI